MGNYLCAFVVVEDVHRDNPMKPVEDTLRLYNWIVVPSNSTPHNVDKYGFSATESIEYKSGDSKLFYMRKPNETVLTNYLIGKI